MNTSAPLTDTPTTPREHERRYRFRAGASFAALIAAFVLLPYGELYPPIYVMGFLAAIALACYSGGCVAVVVYLRSRRIGRPITVPTVVLGVSALTAVINLAYLLDSVNSTVSACLVICLIFTSFCYAGTMAVVDETKGRSL